MNKENIVVLGIGPVGLATALGFASVGYHVVCCDVDEHKIQHYNNSELPFYEKNLKFFFERYKKNLTFSSSLSESVPGADFIFITVGTPQSSKSNDGVDMNIFWNAIRDVVKYAKHKSIIVIKSTVPLGTNSKVLNYIKEQNLSSELHVVSNPEFLAQGTSIADTINASRIVLGTNDLYSKDKISKVYDLFSGEKIFTDPISAELIKYFANSYLAMRVSFFNEISNVCEFTSAKIEDVIKGVTLDARIGTHYCSPSIGYGGSCFPKDTFALLQQIKNKYSYDLRLVRATIDINENQKMKLAQKLHDDCAAILDDEIAILGLTYKSDTDDLRCSVSIENVNYLLSLGHKLVVWDPIALSKAHELWGEKINYSISLIDAISRCKYIYIATDWPQIKNLDLKIFYGKKVYDGRNCLLGQKHNINFNYSYVGGEIKYDEKHDSNG